MSEHTNELKLPWHILGEIFTPSLTGIYDCNDEYVFSIINGSEEHVRSLLTACNSHLDLTATVSELKHLLEKRRDENTTLSSRILEVQAENKRLREALGQAHSELSTHPDDRTRHRALGAIQEALNSGGE